MITVLLSFPDGAQKECLLSGVPAQGDRVRRGSRAGNGLLIVERVVFQEGDPEPSVVLIVRPEDK